MLLVTGGAGYVGSHFVHEYARQKNEPILVIDDESEGHPKAVTAGAKLVKCNLGDQEQMEKVFTENSIDAVVHFAASAYVGVSQEVPFKYFNNNVLQTIRLFEVMEKYGVRKVVFSSTCATYGTPQYVPIDEQHPQMPINVYGYTKLMVEKALLALSISKGWSFVALRYFNAAGASDDGSIGERHEPETHLIPLILKAAKGEIPHIQINGTDYDTPDGTCIRDYIHVTDLADAHIRALDLMRSQQVTEFVNLGTAYGASVRQVIDTCAKVTGKKIPERVGPRRSGDPASLVANAAKAGELLGWKPQRDLQQIIESAWRWEQNPKY